MIKLTHKTNQGIFNAVCKHLRSMEERAFDTESESCEYLTKDGNKCAISAVLRCSNKVRLTLVGSITELIEKGKVDPGKINYYLLHDLQCIHDRNYNWQPSTGKFCGEDDLIAAATQFGLKYNAPA